MTILQGFKQLSSSYLLVPLNFLAKPLMITGAATGTVPHTPKDTAGRYKRAWGA